MISPYIQSQIMHLLVRQLHYSSIGTTSRFQGLSFTEKIYLVEYYIVVRTVIVILKMVINAILKILSQFKHNT